MPATCFRLIFGEKFVRVSRYRTSSLNVPWGNIIWQMVAGLFGSLRVYHDIYAHFPVNIPQMGRNL
jgi:hypothetical protein